MEEMTEERAEILDLKRRLRDAVSERDRYLSKYDELLEGRSSRSVSEAIRAVLYLHKSVPMVPGLEETPVCDGCDNPGRFVFWPCSTVRAITEHLQ